MSPPGASVSGRSSLPARARESLGTWCWRLGRGQPACLRCPRALTGGPPAPRLPSGLRSVCTGASSVHCPGECQGWDKSRPHPRPQDCAGLRVAESGALEGGSGSEGGRVLREQGRGGGRGPGAPGGSPWLAPSEATSSPPQADSGHAAAAGPARPAAPGVPLWSPARTKPVGRGRGGPRAWPRAKGVLPPPASAACVAARRAPALASMSCAALGGVQL